MSKSKTKQQVSSEIGFVEPYIENFDELKRNSKKIKACWDEIERLVKEIEDMNYPIKYRLSWTEE